MNAHVDALNRALSCVARSSALASGLRSSSGSLDIAFNRGFPARLTEGIVPTALRFDQRIELTQHRDAPARERWQVALLAYRYALLEPVTEHELLAFHWHPGDERIGFPHLHLGSRILRVVAFANRHVPTGRIAITDVIRFAIAELQVAPLREDWERVLAEADAEQPG